MRMEDHLLILKLENHPDYTLLRCSGRILRGDGADELLQVVKAQADRNLQIDLGDVEAIDASGLGALATLEKWAAEQGRTLQVVNPMGIVREAIEATHLNFVLQGSSTQTSHAAA